MSGNTRTRGTSSYRGTAQPRTWTTPGGGSSYPGWSYWYPWYSFGVSSRYGYFYDPWSYWYDPFGYWYGYRPYGYAPFGYYWGYGAYSGGDRDDDSRDEEFGSIRLRVNPREAKVYVDGALAGIVDDFDGLSDHLELPAGVHELELRADGYQTYTTQVTVEAGRTLTTRASLEREN